MSDNILKLIPNDPYYVPRDGAIQRAYDLIVSLFPKATSVDYQVLEKVTFIDQGQNWERILCPLCKTEIDQDWWGQQMDIKYQTGFVDLAVKLPCCGDTISLNDLQYEWPAGLARFVFEIWNPGADIDQSKLGLLGEILGCPQRTIWAHI